MTTSIGAISEDSLVDLHADDPWRYEEELDALLGKGVDDKGFRKLDKDPVIPHNKFSFVNLGEAFIGPRVFHRVMQNPYGMRGGRAFTQPPPEWRFEDAGGGALGPDSFVQIQAWLATIDRLLDARLLDKYQYAVLLARELMDWRLDQRIQESKLPRYSIPTTAPGGGDGPPGDDGLKPGEELPSGDMTAEYVRQLRMQKQGLSLSIAWESFHFDQTGSLMEAADRISERFAIRIDERMDIVLWGLRPGLYKYNDVATDVYRTAGNYVNFLPNNDLTIGEKAIDLAEQQLLKQTDPATGLEIEPEGDKRVLVCTPARWRTSWRLQNPLMVNTGALTDPEQVRADGAFNFTLHRERRGTRLMQLPVNRGGLGLSQAQAEARWIWGNPKAAFVYNSATDLRTYRYNIGDSPSLSKRDLLMEIDCVEMGFPSPREVRHVILSGIP